MAELPTRQAPEEQSWASTWSSLPRMWVFLGYLLPRGIRERQFRPTIEDLYQGYLVDLIELKRMKKRRRLGKVIMVLVLLGMNILFAFWVAKAFVECLLGMFKK